MARCGRRRAWWVMVPAVLLAVGCNRQDAECLGRIGGLLRQRFEALKQQSPNTGLAQAVPGLSLSDDGRALERSVENRLHSEPALANLPIQVRAEGGRVRLTGRVRDDDERRRVLTAVEEAAGAGNVIDALERE